MEKNKFIQILESIKTTTLTQFEKKLLFSKELVNFEDILTLNDEEVEDVLKTTKIELKISKMYFYMKKDSLPEDIRNKFREDLEQEETLYTYLKILERFNYLEREDGLDYVRVIMNSNGASQKKYASELIFYNEILEKNNSLEIIKLVAMQEEEEEAKKIQIEILSSLGNEYKRYGRNDQSRIVTKEKSIKELMTHESLGDLILGLKESDEEEVSLDTKVNIKVRKVFLV